MNKITISRSGHSDYCKIVEPSTAQPGDYYLASDVDEKLKDFERAIFLLNRKAGTGPISQEYVVGVTGMVLEKHLGEQDV